MASTIFGVKIRQCKANSSGKVPGGWRPVYFNSRLGERAFNPRLKNFLQLQSGSRFFTFPWNSRKVKYLKWLLLSLEESSKWMNTPSIALELSSLESVWNSTSITLFSKGTWVKYGTSQSLSLFCMKNYMSFATNVVVWVMGKRTAFSPVVANMLTILCPLLPQKWRWCKLSQ